MKFEQYGLVNTNQMLITALKNKYAVPAFNFYNMETLQSVISAAREMHSPVIMAVSTSALKYMTPDILMGMIKGANLDGKNFALHLDHGGNFEDCKTAIDIGFSSVMIDASDKPLLENIEITKRVVEYAKKFNVSVESELGTLAGVEDENTQSETSIYTDPKTVLEFYNQTNVDSLAVAIGTSHGGYKRKSNNEELRFDILDEISKLVPNLPLVLHGASSIPVDLVNTINQYGGQLKNAAGIPTDQIIKTTEHNVCKINVDSDSRLAFTAAIREHMAKHPDDFNPRSFLMAGIKKSVDVYKYEIENIMKSKNQAI